MSKIIEATNKLINGDKEALSLVDKITDDLFETHYDFEDINCVNTTKELLAGHIVYYGLSKIKSIAKDGYSERTNYRLMIHGVFRPLDGARVTDEKIINQVKDEIAARN